MIIDVSLYSRARGDPERIGDISVHGDRSPGGHDYILPPASQSLGAVWEEVVHAQSMEL